MISTPATGTTSGAARDRSSYGIHAHVNRLSHVVINVSDLDRAVEFYERVWPVRRLRRINGPAQAYVALGVERGEFEGWILRSNTAERPPGAIRAESPPRDVHLVQWKTPGPVGTPYAEANHVGIYRHNALVGDIEAAYAQVVAHGGRPYGEPSRILLTPEGFGVWCFGFRDPDGSTLEMVGPDVPEPGYPGSLHHCNINCTDLKRSYRFYRDIMGLDTGLWYAPGKPQPVASGSLGDSLRNPDGSRYIGAEMEFAANLMIPRTDWRNPLDVLEWTLPKPFGTAYESPMNLGISRIAVEVDDIEAAHRKLVETGHGPVSAIDRWDMGEFGERRVVILRDPDGVWLELLEQPPVPPSPLD
jgi:catechol 2,3-dioxygenase-like lactoylglutathione lyase family enzyme